MSEEGFLFARHADSLRYYEERARREKEAAESPLPPYGRFTDQREPPQGKGTARNR